MGGTYETKTCRSTTVRNSRLTDCASLTRKRAGRFEDSAARVALLERRSAPWLLSPAPDTKTGAALSSWVERRTKHARPYTCHCFQERAPAAQSGSFRAVPITAR